MKALKSLFTAIVTVCCVACSKGTMTPVTEKINGPLGNFFEVVSRNYATKDGKVSIEIKRIKDGFPSPWRKGMEVGHNDGCFEPEFIVEFQDADGNVVSKDNTDIIWDSDELEIIASLGVDESATITFDCDKEACKFKISSKFKVNDEQERTISMEGCNDFGTDDDADYELGYDDDSYGSSTGSAEWDEILDTYEQYINKYVSLMKKAAKGDLTALAEYPALMQKAQKLGTKLENAKSDLSASQLSRYITISAKMLEAIQEME